jgi:signal transduction histidine kinase
MRIVRYILLLFLLFCVQFLPAQNKAIDSIQQILHTGSIATHQKVLLLNELANQFIYIKPEKTIEIGKQALALARTKNDSSDVALSLNTIGYGYWGKSNMLEAFDYFRNSMNLSDVLKDEVMVAKNHLNIASIYNQSGYYNKAISILQSLIPVLEKHEINDRLPIAFNSMGYAYLAQNKFDSATKYFSIALPFAKKYKPVIYPTVLFNHANLFFEQKDFNKSRLYLDSANLVAKATNDKRMISRSNQLLAEINLLEGNYDAAFEMATIAVRVSEEAGIKESAVPSFLTLSRASNAKGNTIAALNYLQIYLDLKESVRSKEIASSIGLYEIAQQENKIRILSEEKKDSRIILISVIIAALVLAFFLLYSIHLRNKASRINRLLEQSNNDIANQAKELKELNEVKSKLFSIIAHDVRSPFATIIGILKLMGTNDLEPKDLVPLLPELTQNVGETITMMDNLLNWSRTQLDGVAAKPVLFNIDNIIQSKVQLYQAQADLKKITFVRGNSNHYSVFADIDMIQIVLQNLINNAIKFTNSGGQITINTVVNSDDTVSVSVTDSGKGMTKDNISLLFKGHGFSTNGTANEKGLGLGFKICQEFITLNNGKISIDSELNVGSTVKITLPGKAN